MIGVADVRSQRAISSSSGTIPARRVEQEQRDVGAGHGGFGLHAHPAGQRLRVVILVTGGIDDAGNRARADARRPRAGRG